MAPFAPAGWNSNTFPWTQLCRRCGAWSRGLEFDICEMAFTTYLCAKAYGKPITAIPVFLTRNFHHWAIFYNVKSGIKKPQDLEGRIVGVNRGYTVTTGLWARGILQRNTAWTCARSPGRPPIEEHVAEYKAPSNVDLSYRGRPLAELLGSGEIPAAVGDVRVELTGSEAADSRCAQCRVCILPKNRSLPDQSWTSGKGFAAQSQSGIGQGTFRRFPRSQEDLLWPAFGSGDRSISDG